MPLAITAATPAFCSMARSFSLSPTARVHSCGTPSRSASARSASPGGGHFHIFRRPLYDLHARDGAEAGQRSRSLLRGFKKHAELFNGKGVAAHPLGCVPQNGKAAIVGLARFGAVLLCCPGSGQRYAVGIGAGVSVRENAQVGVAALADRKGFAGSLHRHQAVQQADRGAGAVLFCVGIAAVHCAHGVAAQIPHGGTVAGDDVADAGQLRHLRRQTGQRTAGGGHDVHAFIHSSLQSGAGAGGDVPLAVQQGAVQIQRDQTDGGKFLWHDVLLL